jgi:hypothetical protein
MKRAWIITQEGTERAQEVIGILSARKSGRIVKEYVEWLYALLNYLPYEHFGIAKYNNPLTLYEAQYGTTNLGVPVDTLMTCGHNPWLVARLGSNISLSDGEPPLLSWKQPDGLVQDPSSLKIIEKIPGPTCTAPVMLPLRHLMGYSSCHAPE